MPPAPLPDFKAKAAADQAALGAAGVDRLLAAGRAWDLAPLLRAGGVVIFPHASIATCGHQIAAAVQACLGCGAPRVLALGVLHGLSPELAEARARVAAGGDPAAEPLRGVQGPGLPGREDWRREFSLDHFSFLWREALRRRGGEGPELVLRFPFLAAERPAELPGLEALRALAEGAALVATADPMHHGIAYGDMPETALSPEAGGLALARRRIEEGLRHLATGDAAGYHRHCLLAKSDARDVGPALLALRGGLRGRILDLVADDMTGPYNAPAPSWVAGALIALERSAARGPGV